MEGFAHRRVVKRAFTGRNVSQGGVDVAANAFLRSVSGHADTFNLLSRGYVVEVALQRHHGFYFLGRAANMESPKRWAVDALARLLRCSFDYRSEERRVGKECRSRW